MLTTVKKRRQLEKLRRRIYNHRIIYAVEAQNDRRFSEKAQHSARELKLALAELDKILPPNNKFYRKHQFVLGKARRIVADNFSL